MHCVLKHVHLTCNSPMWAAIKQSAISVELLCQKSEIEVSDAMINHAIESAERMKEDRPQIGDYEYEMWKEEAGRAQAIVDLLRERQAGNILPLSDCSSDCSAPSIDLEGNGYRENGFRSEPVASSHRAPPKVSTYISDVPRMLNKYSNYAQSSKYDDLLVRQKNKNRRLEVEKLSRELKAERAYTYKLNKYIDEIKQEREGVSQSTPARHMASAGEFEKVVQAEVERRSAQTKCTT